MVQLELAGRTVQPLSGLASLPETAIACIFLQLRRAPATAASLAQTCCACALEFAVQRSGILKQKCWDLRPGYTFSWRPSCTATIRWPDSSVLKQLYALSTQAEAVEAMWEAVFAEVFKHFLADTEPQGDRHALTHVTIHVVTSTAEFPVWAHHAQELNAVAHAKFQMGLTMQQSPVHFTCVNDPFDHVQTGKYLCHMLSI